MRHGGRNPFSPNVREYAGLTATVTDGKRAYSIVVRPLHVTLALEALAALCDAGGLRVVTISTPGTILADLIGRPDLRLRRGGSHHVHTPEDALLGKIGRIDLLWKADA